MDLSLWTHIGIDINTTYWKTESIKELKENYNNGDLQYRGDKSLHDVDNNDEQKEFDATIIIILILMLLTTTWLLHGYLLKNMLSIMLKRQLCFNFEEQRITGKTLL